MPPLVSHAVYYVSDLGTLPEAGIQMVTLEKIRTLILQTFTRTVTLEDAARCKITATVWSCQTIGDRKTARDRYMCEHRYIDAHTLRSRAIAKPSLSEKFSTFTVTV